MDRSFVQSPFKLASPFQNLSTGSLLDGIREINPKGLGNVPFGESGDGSVGGGWHFFFLH